MKELVKTQELNEIGCARLPFQNLNREFPLNLKLTSPPPRPESWAPPFPELRSEHKKAATEVVAKI